MLALCVKTLRKAHFVFEAPTRLDNSDSVMNLLVSTIVQARLPCTMTDNLPIDTSRAADYRSAIRPINKRRYVLAHTGHLPYRRLATGCPAASIYSNFVLSLG